MGVAKAQDRYEAEAITVTWSRAAKAIPIARSTLTCTDG
jgi:hypothetical protein